MKISLISFLIFIFQAGVVKSQITIDEMPTHIAPGKPPLDHRIPIIKALGGFMDVLRLVEVPKNHVYTFSVSLSINQYGVVDSVYFTNSKSKYLQEVIIKRPKLIKALKSINYGKEFYNKLLVLPVILKRAEDPGIDNVSEFLAQVVTIWPEYSLKDRLKQTVLFQPYINGFYPPLH